MTRQEMIDLVKRYFGGVDGADFGVISETLTDDCKFSVETHGVRSQGKNDIEQMFERLWHIHASVQHLDFRFVPAPDEDRIAAQFTVLNTHHDGSQTHKSNCNFFAVRDVLFSHVAVYMAGENTLNT
jgi:hypothetical protein